MASVRAVSDVAPSDAASDAVLVAGVARGDASAFRLLLDRHMTAVHRLAVRLLGNTHEAEEVTQDTLLKLWTEASRWRPGPDVSALPWLRRVATNACLDRLRRRRHVADEEVPDRADAAPPAPALIDAERLSFAVTRALANVPDRQRAALVLTYYEELSNGEAARVLDLHVKAFESLLLRARATLRSALTRQGLTADDLRGLP